MGIILIMLKSISKEHQLILYCKAIYAYICAIVEMEVLPVNWDHTGLKYVPVSSWAMAKEDSKQVEISGNDDKHQITAVFAVTLDG